MTLRTDVLTRVGAALPPTGFEIDFKAPLFRSLSDTAKGPELFLLAGAKTAVVGTWSPRWVVVRNGGYLYALPAQRLKNFDPNTLPKPVPTKGFRVKTWYEMLAGTNEKVKALIADLQQAMLTQGRDPSKF